MKKISSLVVAFVLLTWGAGCTDKVGATQGDVDNSLAEHAADSSAHHAKTTDAAELTSGTLDSARLDPALTGAVSSNTTGVSTNAADISTNAGNIASNTSDIATNTGGIATNGGDISTNAGDIATNSGDIATNAGNIATNTTAIGNAQTDIANLKSGSVTVSMLDAAPGDTTWETIQDLLPAGIYTVHVAPGGPANGYWTKSVSLPDGANVTSFSCRLYDNDATYNINCNLYQNDPVAQLASVATTGQNTAMQTLVDNTITAALLPIDNTSHSYFVFVYLRGNTGETAMSDVRIAYTIP